MFFYIYPYTNREERKRLWGITIGKIVLYKTLVAVEWKDSIKIKHSLANIRMYGGDEGGWTLHLNQNQNSWLIFKMLKDLSELLGVK
jgi:hypothetical protein